MSFFQNVFTSEFIGSLVLGDRQHIPSFKAKPNVGRGEDLVTVWSEPPYDLSGNDGDGNSKGILKITFAFDVDFNNWSTISVDIRTGAASPTSVTASEIVGFLNSNIEFKDRFNATLQNFDGGNHRIYIRQKMAIGRFKFYINNTGAETVLKFNARAGVNELPSYFSRHTMDNVRNFSDCTNNLILLDTSLVVDQEVINNAVDHNGKSLGYSHLTVLEDWQLFAGKSGIFNFQKITVDGSDRITEIIEYPAGAKVGDFSRKVNYSYTGANKNPSKITEIPYVIQSSDLVTP